MEQSIKADLHRYSQSAGLFNYIRAIFSHPGARFMYLYRQCRKFGKKHPLGLMYRIFYKFTASRFNVEIPHSCKLGEGVYMGHFKNIVINQHASVGQNCNIMQGVTIGNESRGKRRGAPVIGNRVLIGPNSVVSGKITVGDDVLIAPLTFVNFDVPNNAVVIGNPAKIVSYNGSKGYINKVLNK